MLEPHSQKLWEDKRLTRLRTMLAINFTDVEKVPGCQFHFETTTLDKRAAIDCRTFVRRMRQRGRGQKAGLSLKLPDWYHEDRTEDSFPKTKRIHF